MSNKPLPPLPFSPEQRLPKTKYGIPLRPDQFRNNLFELGGGRDREDDGARWWESQWKIDDEILRKEQEARWALRDAGEAAWAEESQRYVATTPEQQKVLEDYEAEQRRLRAVRRAWEVETKRLQDEKATADNEKTKMALLDTAGRFGHGGKTAADRFQNEKKGAVLPLLHPIQKAAPLINDENIAAPPARRILGYLNNVLPIYADSVVTSPRQISEKTTKVAQDQTRKYPNRLCIYCGGGDHFVSTCPTKKREETLKHFLGIDDGDRASPEEKLAYWESKEFQIEEALRSPVEREPKRGGNWWRGLR